MFQKIKVFSLVKKKFTYLMAGTSYDLSCHVCCVLRWANVFNLRNNDLNLEMTYSYSPASGDVAIVLNYIKKYN